MREGSAHRSGASGPPDMWCHHASNEGQGLQSAGRGMFLNLPRAEHVFSIFKGCKKKIKMKNLGLQSLRFILSGFRRKDLPTPVPSIENNEI